MPCVISADVFESPSTKVILIGVFSAAVALGACSSATTLTNSGDAGQDTIHVQQSDAGPGDAAGDDGADAGDGGMACDPTVTYASFGMAFFQKYCGHCHLWDQTAAQEEGDILIAAGGPGGFMPPGSPLPTDQERQRLADWITCGAP